MFDEYQELDITGKLICNFRNISHFLRNVSGGKGSQKRILTILLKSGRVTQTALTEHLGIRPGSASEVLSKMEAAGLIARRENGADRRTADVELTHEGERQAVSAAEERKKIHGEMFAELTQGEREELLLLLERVAARCGELGCRERREEGGTKV